MNNYLKKVFLPLLLSGLVFFASSCGNHPNDEEIQASVQNQLRNNPEYGEIISSVKDGVLTLEGICKSTDCDSLIENELKGLDGVESIDNKIQVDVATDLTLRTAVQSIISNYEGVQADVAAGVVVLRGSIDKKQVEPLMNELKALSPKKLDNQLALK